MKSYLCLINYTKEIQKLNYIEKSYSNLKEKFGLVRDISLYKTNNVILSNSTYSKTIDNNHYTIMFTGTIYNSKDIKNMLKKLGYEFSTKTKLKNNNYIINIEEYLICEILISAYHEFKEKFLNYLNGNFSICIYNKKDNNVFVARDRLGIKPLYYSKIDTTNIISTSIKEILNIPNFKAVIDKLSIAELIGLRSISYTRINIF
ncbi:MAG: hypothetical protein RSE41_06090 [Clostridia bacterium]